MIHLQKPRCHLLSLLEQSSARHLLVYRVGLSLDGMRLQTGRRGKSQQGGRFRGRDTPLLRPGLPDTGGDRMGRVRGRQGRPPPFRVVVLRARPGLKSNDLEAVHLPQSACSSCSSSTPLRRRAIRNGLVAGAPTLYKNLAGSLLTAVAARLYQSPPSHPPNPHKRQPENRHRRTNE